MYLTKEKKQKSSLNSEHLQQTQDLQRADCIVQSPYLYLTINQNRKDHNTERSLIALVGKEKLLNYLKKTDITRYRAIVEKLGLRNNFNLEDTQKGNLYNCLFAYKTVSIYTIYDS